MIDSEYVVIQLLLERSLNPFNILHTCYRYIEYVLEEIWCKFVSLFYFERHLVLNLAIFGRLNLIQMDDRVHFV